MTSLTELNAATPGPWSVKTERIIVAQVSYIDDRGRERFYDKEIAWMQPIGSAVPGSREANARVVAAAPCLLAAAVEMLDARRALEVAPTARPIDSEIARHERAIEALKQAVAKAIGQ